MKQPLFGLRTKCYYFPFWIPLEMAMKSLSLVLSLSSIVYVFLPFLFHDQTKTGCIVHGASPLTWKKWNKKPKPTILLLVKWGLGTVNCELNYWQGECVKDNKYDLKNMEGSCLAANSCSCSSFLFWYSFQGLIYIPFFPPSFSLLSG